MKNLNIKTQSRYTYLTKSLQAFLNTAKKYPVLTAEQELTATHEELVQHNMLFVFSVAKKYDHEGVELMDLVCEGLAGCYVAAQKFDRTKGFRFISHAVWWIRKQIIEFIEWNRGTVRSTSHTQRDSNKIRQNCKGDETIKETAARLGIKGTYLENVIFSPHTSSIDNLNDDDEPFIVLPSDSNTEKLLMIGDTRQMIRRALQRLTEREQLVISHRYLNSYTSSREKIGSILGLTHQRIFDIEKLALKKLKKYIAV